MTPGDIVNSASTGRRPRVLVVHPDQKITSDLTSRLGRHGYAVVTARGAAEARAAVSSEELLAALVADALPTGSGAELLADLRARQPGLKGFVMLSEAHAEGTPAVSRDPTLDVLVQPIDETALLTALKRCSCGPRAADMTTRRQLEARLRDAQRMEVVGELAGGAAHDFNNLLTTIVGYTELAASRLPDDHHAQEPLKFVVEAAGQAAGVARSLMTFSQRIPAAKKPVDLCVVVVEAFRLLRRVLPPTVDATVDVGTGTLAWVHADPIQLQQVVMNLAINARDSMPQGGRLRVVVHPAHREAGPTETDRVDWFQLTFSDTGVGMSPEARQCVFEPLHDSPTDATAARLGLSVVRDIVQDHGGRIEVRSAIGEGTTFTILLPGLPSEAVAPESRAAQVGQRELILLAEGERHIREIIAATLEAANHRVVDVADGTGLLECFDRLQAQVRLLLLDLDLPRQGGLECLRRIRAGGSTTPAIVVTARLDAGLENQLDQDTLLLRKPFQMVELTQLVSSVLRGGRDGEVEA